MQRYLKYLIIPLTSLLLTGCFDPQITPSQTEDVASITLSKNKVRMGVDSKSTVKATSYTLDNVRTEDQSVTWNVIENDGVVSISVLNNFMVEITSLKLGSAKLVCTSSSNDKVTATSLIEVTDEYIPQEISFKDNYKDYVNNYMYDISSAPTLGSAKILVIPVWFTDSKNYIKNKDSVKSDIQTAYFGSETETGWHSVKSYYEVESRGQLTLDGFVSDWYECGSSSSTLGYDKTSSKTTSLVQSAFRWFKTTYSSMDLKDFDRDNDGFIDSIMLIYGAPDYRTLQNENLSNLWAYCYWTGGSANKQSPNVNVFFWASYDFMYNSVSAFRRAGSAYGGGDTSFCKIDAHTFIHEMGHVFGLEDYYDYSEQYNPAASFSMQDFNIGAHDPFSRIAYGWDTAYLPTKSCSIEVNPYESSGDLVLLSSNPDGFNNTPYDEYLLLELYTPTGLNEFDHKHSYNNRYPTGAYSPGFRIWHVDARLLDVTSYDGYDSVSPSLIRNTGITSGRKYTLAMSNTYYKMNSDSNNYITYLGENYADYNILQLIRNSTTTTYKPTDDFSNSSLFMSGSEFSMAKYNKQFKQSQAMNDGSSLGWTIKFKNVTSTGATIELTRI